MKLTELKKTLDSNEEREVRGYLVEASSSLSQVGSHEAPYRICFPRPNGGRHFTVDPLGVVTINQSVRLSRHTAHLGAVEL